MSEKSKSHIVRSVRWAFHRRIKVRVKIVARDMLNRAIEMRVDPRPNEQLTGVVLVAFWAILW